MVKISSCRKYDAILKYIVMIEEHGQLLFAISEIFYKIFARIYFRE